MSNETRMKALLTESIKWDRSYHKMGGYFPSIEQSLRFAHTELREVWKPLGIDICEESF